ncbi:hypothetical protein CPB84DRAFT_1745581 [Gymnopilus junonius]|uniref:Uncharacterized protein n=1 Tax=Gymnopilus junonius TaxID=109634 RepID=A0A9P5NTZ2_GYMJU|nr:hypothetical protein CPB84DRAFT_1745581 [Gymnopilus junonius]
MITATFEQPPQDSGTSTPLPEDAAISFDYTQGSVFLHEGTIYYSPNCCQPVVIPPRTVLVGDPFKSDRHIDASMFKQPVWWTDLYGWLSFVPLSPIFTYAPFAPFCWMPRIERVQIQRGQEPEDWFEMHGTDSREWQVHEQLIVEAARYLQQHFGVSGNPPVVPLVFHYNHCYKSHGVAKHMISIARDWLSIWMGFLSYIISYINLIPASHRKSSEHSHLPPCVEEKAIWYNISLSYLQPPVDLVQQALTLIFDSPSAPLAALILTKYLALGESLTNETLDLLRLEHAPSSVVRFIEKQTNCQLSTLFETEALALQALHTLLMECRDANQIAAESAAAFPTQTMIAPLPNEDKGKLYNHFDDFFMAREKRQAELLKVESVEDRVCRENCERDRPLHNVYIWTKIWSSGGRDVYNRVRLRPSAKETEWSEHELYQKVYNAMTNEWDLCEDFPSPFGNADEPDADLDDNEAPVGHPSNDGADSHQPLISTAELTTIVPMSLSDKTAGELSPPSYSHDILETLRLVYGYTPPLVDVGSSDKHDWHTLLHTLGFVSSLDELPLMDSNRHAITVFMDQILNSSSILSDINDLDTSNYHPLHHLFKFNEVHHLSDKLLVFLSPVLPPAPGH